MQTVRGCDMYVLCYLLLLCYVVVASCIEQLPNIETAVVIYHILCFKDMSCDCLAS
jgi:hypothetical protein